MATKELWTEYNGKGFSAEHASYAERATKDEGGNVISDTYATKTELTAKQDTLTFGYNASSQITSIDSHDLAPSVDSTVYLATYTSTSGAAIKEALNAGKTVVCCDSARYPQNPTFGFIGAYDKSTDKYQFNFISKSTNPYGQGTGDILFDMVFCKNSGTSWFGQYSPLTFKAPTATGQIMKSVSAANGQFDWSLSTIRETPASTAADENKVLTVDSNGTPQWYGPFASDPVGTQLLDNNDDPVLDENSNPVFDNNSATNLWTSFANNEFGARRAYEDQDGQNIKDTYATKSEVSAATASPNDGFYVSRNGRWIKVYDLTVTAIEGFPVDDLDYQKIGQFNGNLYTYAQITVAGSATIGLFNYDTMTYDSETLVTDDTDVVQVSTGGSYEIHAKGDGVVTVIVSADAFSNGGDNG